jgi:hypothetical protein
MLEMFNRMAARLAQPDMAGLLVAYRDDFEVHDRGTLMDWGAPGCEYLWLVRECGTNLLRLRVHSKPAEWFRAALDVAGSKAKVFHVTDRALHEVTRDQAVQLLEPMDYAAQETFDGAIILHRGLPIASLSIKYEERHDESPLYHLAVESRAALNAQQVGALRSAALGEFERRHGFWVTLGDFKIDGIEFSDAMAAARQREAKVVPLRAA